MLFGDRVAADRHEIAILEILRWGKRAGGNQANGCCNPSFHENPQQKKIRLRGGESYNGIV